MVLTGRNKINFRTMDAMIFLLQRITWTFAQRTEAGDPPLGRVVLDDFRGTDLLNALRISSAFVDSTELTAW